MNGRKGIVADALSFGVSALVDNVRLFVMILLEIAGVGILIIPIGILLYSKFGLTIALPIPLFVFFGLLLALLGIGLYLGLNKITLALVDGREPLPQELFSCFRLAPRAVVAMILFLTMVFVGSICLIVPGVLAFLRFALFPYFIIDRNAGIIESLKMSYSVTANYVWDAFALCGAVTLISTICALSSMASIALVPFSALVYSCFYRKLTPKQ